MKLHGLGGIWVGLLVCLLPNVTFAQKGAALRLLKSGGTAAQLAKRGLEPAYGELVLSPAAKSSLWKTAGALNHGARPVTIPGAKQAVLKKALFDKALAAQLLARPQLVKQNLPYTLVRVFSDKLEWSSTGFIFEENRSGKRKLWVAAAHHVAGKKGDQINVMIERKGKMSVITSLTVAVAGRGGKQGIDMALLELPEEFYEDVFALSWAPEPVELGEYVDSYGYSQNEAGNTQTYTPALGREVLKSEKFRFTTTYNFAPEATGNGACGSPVLNRAGQVTGMHCGSLSGTSSFAISYKGVESLLKLFYQGSATRPLIFNDREIAQISITDRLRNLTAYRDGKLVYAVDLDRRVGDSSFSYERLDDLFEFQPGDQVRVRVADVEGRDSWVNFEVP